MCTTGLQPDWRAVLELFILRVLDMDPHPEQCALLIKPSALHRRSALLCSSNYV